MFLDWALSANVSFWHINGVDSVTSVTLVIGSSTTIQIYTNTEKQNLHVY
jgi:hypothetical protein